MLSQLAWDGVQSQRSRNNYQWYALLVTMGHVLFPFCYRVSLGASLLGSGAVQPVVVLFFLLGSIPQCMYVCMDVCMYVCMSVV